MPKRCAVPNCNSGSRAEESKRSVFRVPKDKVIWKMWEAAIPGVIKLHPSQVVCDRHFDEKDIFREWIKRDSDGRIIAQVPYKFPHLNKAAVPVKFGNSSKRKGNGDPSHNYAKVAPSANPFPMKENHANLSKNFQNIGNGSYVSVKPSTFLKPAMQVLKTSVSKLPKTKAVDDAPLPLPLKKSSCKPPEEDSLAHQKPFKVFSSVAINEHIREKDFSTCAEFFTTIPESWSVAELRTENGQRILFSYAVTKIENGVHCPVNQKCVTLDADRTLNYYVYGRHVNQNEITLDRILNENEMLRDILEKFRGTNVCAGLGDVNTNLVPAHWAYQDYVQNWRSKDCFLVSRMKRCDFCVKSRKHILQRMTRLRNRQKLERIRDVSNPVDRCKLSALRIRSRSERRQNLRAKERVKQLQTCVKKQVAQIASMHMTCKRITRHKKISEG